MRLLCFGDSNTYGYDPVSPFGDRYPPNIRWTDHLAQETGWEVLNAGQNGREIPHRPIELEHAIQLCRSSSADILVVMLGSNDLLCNPHFTAENIAARMESFLRSLPPIQVLLIAPPSMQRGAWVDTDRLVKESARLATVFEVLARCQNCFFEDANKWKVDLTFDGVHFSEAGHRAFSAGLQSFFKTI